MPAVGRFRYLESRPTATRTLGALVLLHAFPLNARMWESQLGMASHGWHVIAPQLRGMDGGDQDPPASSIDDFAADVVDLLDALHIDEAVIAGLSLGGYVALAMLRLAPGYFKGLVLADTRPQPDTPEGLDGRRRMLRLLDERGVEAVVDELAGKLVAPATREQRPDVLDRVRDLARASSNGAIGGAITAMMRRPDSTPLLAGIRCPTLIVVGEHDALTPPAVSEDMVRAIPGAELAVIPGAGHLSSMEQPDAFDAALTRFLQHRL